MMVQYVSSYDPSGQSPFFKVFGFCFIFLAYAPKGKPHGFSFKAALNNKNKASIF